MACRCFRTAPRPAGRSSCTGGLPSAHTSCGSSMSMRTCTRGGSACSLSWNGMHPCPFCPLPSLSPPPLRPLTLQALPRPGPTASDINASFLLAGGGEGWWEFVPVGSDCGFVSVWMAESSLAESRTGETKRSQKEVERVCCGDGPWQAGVWEGGLCSACSLGEMPRPTASSSLLPRLASAAET